MPNTKPSLVLLAFIGLIGTFPFARFGQVFAGDPSDRRNQAGNAEQIGNDAAAIEAAKAAKARLSASYFDQAAQLYDQANTNQSAQGHQSDAQRCQQKASRARNRRDDQLQKAAKLEAQAGALRNNANQNNVAKMAVTSNEETRVATASLGFADSSKAAAATSPTSRPDSPSGAVRDSAAPSMAGLDSAGRNDTWDPAHSKRLVYEDGAKAPSAGGANAGFAGAGISDSTAAASSSGGANFGSDVVDLSKVDITDPGSGGSDPLAGASVSGGEISGSSAGPTRPVMDRAAGSSFSADFEPAARNAASPPANDMKTLLASASEVESDASPAGDEVTSRRAMRAPAEKSNSIFAATGLAAGGEAADAVSAVVERVRMSDARESTIPCRVGAYRQWDVRVFSLAFLVLCALGYGASYVRRRYFASNG